MKRRRTVDIANASARGALPIRNPRETGVSAHWGDPATSPDPPARSCPIDVGIPHAKDPEPFTGVQDANVSTPTRKSELAGSNGLQMHHRADRSARKKSVRQLLERTASEEPASDEDVLAHRILDNDNDFEDVQSRDEVEHGDQPAITITPSKRGRGRPKGSKRKRTPTPPRDMPAHEVYFFQNRPSGARTSNNTLASVSLLSHESYSRQIQTYVDPHKSEQDFLHLLHQRSFEQWMFELEEGFNICLYGWGSKMNLLNDFAATVSCCVQPSKVIIVNGYATGLTIRDVLATIMSSVPSLKSQKSGAQPSDSVEIIIKALSNQRENLRLTLLVHSIDSPALRRNNIQALLAALAASSHISLVASADNPNFPILWDVSLRAQFNFLFHDATTYRPFEHEINVVEEVNQLLGRSGRRIDGREGVRYVLKSLTENARRLYTLLLTEQIRTSVEDMTVNNGEDRDADEDEFESAFTGSKRGNSQLKPYPNTRSDDSGIEYRTLYRKAMGELITTNEIGFRTLLKEFYDHEMIVSKKDRMGAELLSVPFRKEELMTILEDLEN